MNACTLPDCSRCPVLADTVFDGCRGDTLVEIAMTRETRIYRSGDTIFAEGEPVTGACCLYSGSVSLLKKDASGIEHLLSRVGPGTLIGFRDPVEPGVYFVSAVADTDVTLCFIPIAEMISLVRHHPSILLRLVESFCRRIGALEAKSAEGAAAPRMPRSDLLYKDRVRLRSRA